MGSISIIMPVFNGSKSIVKALESALRQTIDKEIIVIDDCSTDGTYGIVQIFLSNHANVRIYRMDCRVGPGLCRNFGLSKVANDYVAFLDADDIFPENDSLERMVSACEANGLDICGSLRQSRTGLFVRRNGLFRELFKNDSQVKILDYQDCQYDYDFTSYVYRTRFLLDQGITFPNLSRYQDVPFFVSAMVAAKRFCVVPVEGYRYTVHKSSKFDETQTMDILRGMLMVMEIADREGLQILKTTTIRRLDHEYSGIISPLVANNEAAQDLCNRIRSYSDFRL